MPSGEKTAARMQAQQELRVRQLNVNQELQVIRDPKVIRAMEQDSALSYSQLGSDSRDVELDANGMLISEPKIVFGEAVLVPGVRRLSDADDGRSGPPFRRPADYIEYDEQPPYMYYDMDSEDEEFLSALNAKFRRDVSPPRSSDVHSDMEGSGDEGSAESWSGSNDEAEDDEIAASADDDSAEQDSAQSSENDTFVDAEAMSDPSSSPSRSNHRSSHGTVGNHKRDRSTRRDGIRSGAIRTYARKVRDRDPTQSPSLAGSNLFVKPKVTETDLEHDPDLVITPDEFERLIELFEANSSRLLRYDERGHRRMHRTASGAIDVGLFGQDAAAAAAAAAAEDEADIPCTICGDIDSDAKNEILFCDGCDVAVHQMCYGVRHIPEGNWYCRPCEATHRADDASQSTDATPDPNPGQNKCAFCPIATGAFKQTTQGQWAHVTCALWIPETSFVDPDAMEPIERSEFIPERRWRAVCDVCSTRTGACISCSVSGCSSKFHVMCARTAGFLLELADHRAAFGMRQIQASSSGSVQFFACCRKHTITAELHRGRDSFGVKVSTNLSHTLRRMLNHRREDERQREVNATARLGRRKATLASSDSESELSSDSSGSDVDTLPVPLPLFYRSDGTPLSSFATIPSTPRPEESDVDDPPALEVLPGEPFLPWRAQIRTTVLHRCFQYWRHKRVVVANSRLRSMHQSRGDASHSVASAHSFTSEVALNPQGVPLVREVRLFKRADGRLGFSLTSSDATPEDRYRRLRVLRRDLERVRLLLDQVRRRETSKRALVDTRLKETEVRFRLARLLIDDGLWKRQLTSMAQDEARASLDDGHPLRGNPKKKFLFASGKTRSPELRRMVEEETRRLKQKVKNSPSSASDSSSSSESDSDEGTRATPKRAGPERASASAPNSERRATPVRPTKPLHGPGSGRKPGPGRPKKIRTEGEEPPTKRSRPDEASSGTPGRRITRASEPAGPVPRVTRSHGP